MLRRGASIAKPHRGRDENVSVSRLSDGRLERMPSRKSTKRKPTKAKKAAGRKRTATKKSRKKKLTVRKRAPRKKPPKTGARKKSSRTKAVRKKRTGTKKAASRRRRVREGSSSPDTTSLPDERRKAPPGLQSGDLQGLSSFEGADSESVDELLEEGNAFEASVVEGVEDADDSDEREVHTREVPVDDVPGEYLDQD